MNTQSLIAISALGLVILIVVGMAGQRFLFGGSSDVNVSMPASLQFTNRGVVGENSAAADPEQTPVEAAAAVLNSTSVTDGNTRVQHPTYGFTITVPETTHVERYEEGGRSETLVFYDPEAATEFQLFVTPYDKNEITKERLALDIPSGDVREPKNIVLGNGLSAFMFWSHAPIVGETREVWFIHDGHLYEATVARELDSWLAGILNTISFGSQ